MGRPRVADGTDLVIQLPGPIRLSSPYPFVGRSRELTTLRTLVPRKAPRDDEWRWWAARPGRGRAASFASSRTRWQERACSCSTARATPSCGVPTGLRRGTRPSRSSHRRPRSRRPRSGRWGAHAAPSDLALRIGELGAPITADPDTERHRLHTAVTDVLTNASRRRPLMLVLEDGHWADTPTLLLLRHLARAVTDARILVLATFRDTEADVPAELADALTELRRYDDVVRLRLGGLNEREIAEFLRSASGGLLQSLPSSFAGSVTSPRATRSCSASSGGCSPRPRRSRSSRAPCD